MFVIKQEKLVQLEERKYRVISYEQFDKIKQNLIDRHLVQNQKESFRNFKIKFRMTPFLVYSFIFLMHKTS